MRLLCTMTAVLLTVLASAALTSPATATPSHHINGCQGHARPAGVPGSYTGCGDRLPNYPDPAQQPDETADHENDGDNPTPVDPVDTGPPPPPICEDREIEWHPDSIDQEINFMKWTGRSDRPGPDAYAVDVYCRDPDVPCERYEECDYRRRGWEWRLPGEAPQGGQDPEVLEQELVQAVMAEIAGQLDHPVVRTNPGSEQASIVNIPTFFWVENWTGTFQVESCADNDPNFCITGVLEPHMVLYPGESGADPIACDGPGVPYQPNTALDADQQAEAPEACAYTYRRRTGVAGRPRAWTAQVQVTWDITWTPADLEGTPEVVLDAEVLREVHEIQAVVNE